MIKRMINPPEYRSGDFLQASLQSNVIREQEIGDGMFRCIYCGDPHRFMIHCPNCQEDFPAAMVIFKGESEIPGYVVIAGFCGDCETVNLLTGNCHNVEGTFVHAGHKLGGPMEVFDAQAVTYSELQRISLLWRESGDADAVNSEVLQLVERLTKETGQPVHAMQRPIPSRFSGVLTISVNGSRVGRVVFNRFNMG